MPRPFHPFIDTYYIFKDISSFDEASLTRLHNIGEEKFNFFGNGFRENLIGYIQQSDGYAT